MHNDPDPRTPSGVLAGAGAPPFTLSLHHIREGERALVGGKAANLSRLLHGNLPVPSGFCVTTAALQHFIQSSPKQRELSRLLAQVPSGIPQQLPEFAAQLVGCLAAVPIPPPLEYAILSSWRSLGAERAYAVRSSGTVEDGSEHSFAGQFDSVLNVQSAQSLLAAIRTCWLSLFSPRALAYYAREGLPLEKMSLAVLVQEMVPADVAGVLFTVDPVSGDAQRMLVEAVPGLGDRLVSGRAEPEIVALDKAGFQVIQRRLPPGRAPLRDELLMQLVTLAKEAERLFAQPLDIEWAAVQDRVSLLQARPVTTLPEPRSWEDRQHWSNVNTGEIFPDVATPMTWSVVQRLFVPLFSSFFRLAGADLGGAPAAGLVAGRIYFNANTGVAALKRFRFLTGNLADVAHAIGGGETAKYVRGLATIPDCDVPDIALSWPRYILSWPSILYDLFTHLPHRADAWMRRLQLRTDALVRTDTNPMSTAELIRAIHQTAVGSAQDWDLLYLGLQMPALFLLQKACRDWLGDPQLTLGYRLFAGLGGVPEAEAGLSLWRLAALAQAHPDTQKTLLSPAAWPQVRDHLAHSEPGRRFLTAWDTFISEHGHHCRGEMELFNARWCETPDYILELVRGYLRSLAQLDLVRKHQQLAAERRELTEQCLKRLSPLKRWLFSIALRRAQKLAVTREAWKNEAVRLFATVRRMLLALGARFQSQGIVSESADIFFLELGELESLAAGKPPLDIRELIRSRRAEYEINLRLSPPAGVIGKFNPNTSPAAASMADPATVTIQGIPVSPGIVTGPAHVILHTDLQEQVAPGEILVAPFTDPAWTPYFIPAAGVVIDQGGVLSHGSIVARELGIPAVTSTISATQLIHTGDLLHLDANSGRVTILKRTTGPPIAPATGLGPRPV